MTPIFHQIDPDVFPNPHAFLPERWINIEEDQRIRMERHFTPYSKGARQCAGLKSVKTPESSYTASSCTCCCLSRKSSYQLFVSTLLFAPFHVAELTVLLNYLVSQTQNYTCVSLPSPPASTSSFSKPMNGILTWPSTRTTTPHASTPRVSASSQRRQTFSKRWTVLSAPEGDTCLEKHVRGQIKMKRHR